MAVHALDGATSESVEVLVATNPTELVAFVALAWTDDVTSVVNEPIVVTATTSVLFPEVMVVFEMVSR